MLRRRRHSLKLSAAHKGLTMLEIMIVIAILGLVMGLVVVPKVMDLFSSSKVDIAKLAVDEYANKDFGLWASAHPDKTCPDSLLDVLQHIGKTADDMKDPWDTPYKMLCGANMPAGVSKSGIAVYSFGPDKTENTTDDIKSWEKVKK
jgi:prepilin-type N-terminal cleavage/methylation domain-containing protein